MVRSLGWRLSQPGFDPTYGKILSSHTDESWENETDLSVDDYIYIIQKDEFGIIQFQNVLEDSYKSPAVLNIW